MHIKIRTELDTFNNFTKLPHIISHNKTTVENMERRLIANLQQVLSNFIYKLFMLDDHLGILRLTYR